MQSRYYNPEWGRFINADAYVSTGQGVLGNNMFAYCLNNPIIYVDTSGLFAFDAIDLDGDENDILEPDSGGGIGNFDPQQALLDAFYLDYIPYINGLSGNNGGLSSFP